MLGSVALSEDEQLVAQEQQGVPGTHARRLVASIEHLISVAGWRRLGLEAIAVAIGPGSFTGLRIGLATAKGMALALGCPIVGVSSLEALAHNCSLFDGTVVPLIDARRGEIYAGALEFLGGRGPKTVMKECVLPPDALIKRLKAIKGRMIITGDAAHTYGQRLCKVIGARALIAPWTSSFPQAINLALIALPRLRDGKGDEPSAIVPNYIRHSDAVLRKQEA